MKILTFLSVIWVVSSTLAVPHNVAPSIKQPKSFSIMNSYKHKGLAVSKTLAVRGGHIGSDSVLSVETTGLPLNSVKLLLQLSLTILNVLCWAIPLSTKSFSQNKSFLSIANAFAGGIFLMLGLGHLVPHSIERLDAIHIERKYTFYAVLGGFLLMLFTEKVAFNSHALLHTVCDDHEHSHEHSQSHALPQTFAPSAIVGALTAPPEEINVGIAPTESSGVISVNKDSSVHSSVISEIRSGTLSSTSAIVLLFAMSIHSLFETMALGIASDKISATLMAVSIALHQPAESMALLIAFLKTSMPTGTIAKWLGLFSMVGPLGLCLGLLISKVANPFTDAILVAITAGTFLYVGATEVCNEEFENGGLNEKSLRFVSLVGGIGLIGLISEVTEHWFGGHGHDHHH